MADEFSYTFRRHSIVLTRDAEDRNWYIRVRGPDGLHVYDGYWRDSVGKTLKEALAEAKHGAQLKPYAALGVRACRYTNEPGGACWRQGKAVELCTCHTMTDKDFAESVKWHAECRAPNAAGVALLPKDQS